MSYHIYQTEGFVLGSTPFGEANKRYHIYTREIGLINASAQGIRFIKSKLKHTIDDFVFSDFSLVRGKEFWRLTSVKEAHDGNKKLTGKSLIMFARISGLLRRLLHGEEKNEYLYDTINTGFAILSSGEVTKDGFLEDLEALMVLKILFALGYIDDKGDIFNFLKSSTINKGDVKNFSPHRKQVLKIINDALKESQL